MNEDETTAEPRTWPDQFKAAMDVLLQRDKTRRAERASKEFLDRKAREAKHREVYRAKLTREFMASEFYTAYFGPLLSSGQVLKPVMLGEKKTLEEVAVDHLLGSGRVLFGRMISDTFDEWLRIGNEAEKKIADDNERRARAEREDRIA